MNWNGDSFLSLYTFCSLYQLVFPSGGGLRHRIDVGSHLSKIFQLTKHTSMCDFFSRKRLIFKFRVWFQPISPLKVKSHTFFLNIMFSWYSLLTFIKARMRRGIWIRKQTFQLFCSTNWRISQKSIWKIWFIWRLTMSIIGISSWMSFCNTTQTNELQMGTMGILNSDL